MPFRPVAGILAAFLLLPPLLGASEVACPRHGNDGAAAAAAEPMEGHAHHQGSQQDTTPSEHHPISDCCPAMSTCAGSTAIQVVDDALSLWFLHNDVPADLVTLSRSRVESPEPPPPKV